MTYGYYNASAESASVSPVVWVVYAIIMIVELAALWKLFVKAGKPGWAVLIPIYNVLVMIEIAKKEWWYILLLLIPFVNFVVNIMITVAFVKAYGKDNAFAVLTIFFAPIMYPILAFGDSQYQG